MAIDMNDLMMLKGLDSKEGFSPYEQVKIQHMQSKHPSGTSIGALSVGIGAAVVGLGGWFWAASQAKNAKDVAIAKNDGLKDLVTTLATTVAAERSERIAGDVTLNQTITDTVSGSQQGQLSAQQQAELAASQVATQTVMTGLMTGRYSENPQRVALYRDAQACGCPATGCGCGCNG